MQQSAINHDQTPIELQTKKQFLVDNLAYTSGGLDWLIFNQKQVLIDAGAIAYFGTKVFINTPVFNRLVLDGGTRYISGVKQRVKRSAKHCPPTLQRGERT